MGKKIVLIGTTWPFRGGLAAFNERLGEQFVREGDEFEFFTFTLQYPKIFFPGKTQMATWDAPDDLKINIKVNAVNPLNWLKVGKIIKNLKPDLVLVKYWMPFFAPCFGTILRKIKQNKHTRVISILDNILPHEPRPGDRMLTQYFVNVVDSFIAMSKSVAEDLKIFSDKPVKISPHPLFDNFGDVAPKEKALKNLGLANDGTKYMLFFGLIRRYKGLDILLDALKELDLKALNIKLIIAGEFYDEQDKYEQQIKDNGLSEFIILHDFFIPNDKVADYFNAGDVVVQPYKTATQSGVTQIAYHFNKAMIVSDVGGLPEIVPHEKCGLVVKPDASSIAKAIADFYQNNMVESTKAGIVEQKKKFAWGELTRSINELYSKL
ncbi:glycosyltransferase [Bacteroidales bacterium]|nr:glycosyltransferase [Bacteroidales bacterium]